MGVGPDYFGIDIINLVNGRVFNQNDAREARKVVVLGYRAKDVLFGDKEAIGEYINIKGGFFKVIGYFKKEGNNGRFEERVFIPYATYQVIFNPAREVQAIALTAQPGVEVTRSKTRCAASCRNATGSTPRMSRPSTSTTTRKSGNASRACSAPSKSSSA
jgi:putative ABC transport system permease protein